MDPIKSMGPPFSNFYPWYRTYQLAWQTAVIPGSCSVLLYLFNP